MISQEAHRCAMIQRGPDKSVPLPWRMFRMSCAQVNEPREVLMARRVELIEHKGLIGTSLQRATTSRICRGGLAALASSEPMIPCSVAVSKAEVASSQMRSRGCLRSQMRNQAPRWSAHNRAADPGPRNLRALDASSGHACHADRVANGHPVQDGAPLHRQPS